MAHLVRDRLARRVRPLVTITDPPSEGVIVERDVAVPMRDGVTLRVDVFRPATDEPVAVLLCAHPYGKDNTPPRRRHGYGIPRQYRVLTQSSAFSHSAWTSWEAPDPAHWVSRGYAVINADLRGWGHSEGEGELFSEQEGRDGHDLVEWAAAQPWSTGRVGMTGVSYLAISQWAVAAERSRTSRRSVRGRGSPTPTAIWLGLGESVRTVSWSCGPRCCAWPVASR